MKLDRTFQPFYREITSPETLALISELNRIFVPFFKKRFENFLEIIYKRFFQGSIGIDFDILFQTTSNVSNSSIVEALEEGNGTTQLAFVVIIGDITVTEQLPVTQTTVQSPSAAPTEPDKLETWVIVLIVTGTVAIVLLVIVVVMTVAYRRQVQRDKLEMLPSYSAWELRRLELDTMPTYAENGHATLNENGTANTTNISLWHKNETNGHAVNKAYLDDSPL